MSQVIPPIHLSQIWVIDLEPVIPGSAARSPCFHTVRQAVHLDTVSAHLLPGRHDENDSLVAHTLDHVGQHPLYDCLDAGDHAAVRPVWTPLGQHMHQPISRLDPIVNHQHYQ